MIYFRVVVDSGEVWKLIMMYVFQHENVQASMTVTGLTIQLPHK